MRRRSRRPLPLRTLDSGARHLYIPLYNMHRGFMRNGRPSQDIRPLSEFRASVATFVEQVQATQRPLVLTQHGRSAAILLAVDAYEALVERAELAEDVRVAEAQLAAGQGVAHGKAQALVLARLRAPGNARKRTA